QPGCTNDCARGPPRITSRGTWPLNPLSPTTAQIPKGLSALDGPDAVETEMVHALPQHYQRRCYVARWPLAHVSNMRSSIAAAPSSTGRGRVQQDTMDQSQFDPLPGATGADR